MIILKSRAQDHRPDIPIFQNTKANEPREEEKSNETTCICVWHLMAADAPLTTNHTEMNANRPSILCCLMISGMRPHPETLAAFPVQSRTPFCFVHAAQSSAVGSFICGLKWKFAENRMYFCVSARHAPSKGPLPPKHTTTESALVQSDDTHAFILHTHTAATSTSLRSAV